MLPKQLQTSPRELLEPGPDIGLIEQQQVLAVKMLCSFVILAL